MKSVLILMFASVCFTHTLFAQCPEPQPKDLGVVKKKLSVTNKQKAEFGLAVSATVPGGSWGKLGSEAAVLTIFVDGKYNQDVMLFNGAKKFEYKALIGQLVPGKHDVTLSFNKERSSKNIGDVSIESSRIFEISNSGKDDDRDADRLAVENAPILYARANIVDKFSDIPLITYYEILPSTDGTVGIRYSTIFANEDGGTQTTALMARWGRATDIEWVYEVRFKDGKRVSEIYQGANHVTKPFEGRRIIGEHPVFTTATDNNNFSDAGCSPFRTALIPMRADLSSRSRETIMDENPWTYRIMAEEATREGRVDPSNMGVNVIDDLRNYAYVEVFSENNGTAVSVELTAVDGKISYSDLKDERLRVGRPGFQRIAVRMPSSSPIRSLRLVCHQISARQERGSCGRSEIEWFVRLDKDLTPSIVRPKTSNSRRLESGESLEWQLSAN